MTLTGPFWSPAKKPLQGRTSTGQSLHAAEGKNSVTSVTTMDQSPVLSLLPWDHVSPKVLVGSKRGKKLQLSCDRANQPDD